MSDLISQNINVFLRSCIKALGHFIFMWGISWRLTLVAVMGFPFVGLVSQLYGDYYKVRVQRSIALDLMSTASPCWSMLAHFVLIGWFFHH